jgi:sugar (pentulose or hexulose) kinase
VSRARGELVLTVDGGGSSVKAAVYSVEERAPVAVAAREVVADYPGDGLAEFDTDVWWGRVVAAISGAVEAADRPPSAYLAITCTGMRIPFVLLDAAGDVLAPCVLNVDRRGKEYLGLVRDALGPEELYRLTGHWPNAKLGLPKLLWFVHERPELWRRVRRVLQFHDWLVYRLSGAVASEPSSAAMSQLLDVERRAWAPELLAAVGLDPGLLPELRDGGTEVGGLLAEVARETGLAAGTPVHVGAGDTHVAALAAGGAAPGTVTIVGGSTTPVMYASGSPRAFAHVGGPLVSPHALPGLWAFETNAGATGALYTWLRDLAGDDLGADGYAALDDLADAAPVGARGLLVAGANPFWGEDAWERVPPTTLLGIEPSHRLGDLARAVLESIAQAVRSNLEALESALGERASSIVLTGGASRSALGRRLLADVLGRTVAVPDVQEPAAVGGAVLVAGESARGEPPVEIVDPDPGRVRAYDEHAVRYREAYARLRDGFES